ncbi:glycoside hydrolase family 3 N-terminal domain-containing protein [Alistipes timonensis]|uniref:glycoside hydrolase family 3 N-terminal domain-containing protein n=1 Tax=Alistipes timonensis TaxID=1465754 RepID=UPI00189A181C|nr:glycoside hydrolase family 3 N-terminal domain-containing protein [Alistipes timonensis]
MKRRLFGRSLLAVAVLGSACCSDSSEPLYKDVSQPVERRIDDLMGRMTLHEKIGQMCQFVGLEHLRMAEQNATPEEIRDGHAQGYYPGYHSTDILRMVEAGEASSFFHVVTPEEANYLQGLAQKSRLQIPLLIGIDAIHGNGLYSGATIYPTSIGQAATFDPDLVERLCRETALEMRAMGAQWTFNPNVEVARDARWGRCGESFGEDPLLVGRMGAASVRGYQGADFTGTDRVIACAKHFVGGSQPVNGINGAPFDASERTLREIFLPPFRACIEAGVHSVMAAHNEVNGHPAHGSKWLLTDLLRGEMGFEGFIVSDWKDVERLVDKHAQVATEEEAFIRSVACGMDMRMHGPVFIDVIQRAVEQGVISEKRIDEACRGILEAKFRLGLFENPFVDAAQTAELCNTSEHRATALEAARKSIVLLKNDGLLPIDFSKYRRILVAGPNADSHAVLGDWALPQPAENIVTVLAGLKQIAPDCAFREVCFGNNPKTMQAADVDRAVAAARTSDLAVLVVGENGLRYDRSAKTCGENIDRWDLGLYGLQQELVERVAATGTPTVVVLINGRPLALPWIKAHIPAVVEAWEPGCMGGQAVAEVLAGKVNPSGKLPMSFPKHVGQQMVNYNRKLSSLWAGYVEGDNQPLWEFGYGLSYTTFAYDALTIDKTSVCVDDVLKVSVDVANTGDRAGEEVVQLYIHDLYSVVTRPIKELRDFRRVALAPGERKRVEFTLPVERLGALDENMRFTVEAGDYEIMAGSSSADRNLLKTTITVKK